MPSNPTLPEAVKETIVLAMGKHGLDPKDMNWCVCGDWEEGDDWDEHMLDAIAPLIIEWARKDQAEKDAQIVEFKIRNYRTIGSPGRADAARDIRAQFDTPETTGGTK